MLLDSARGRRARNRRCTVLRSVRDRWWSSRGVERTRAESVRRWGVSSPHFYRHLMTPHGVVARGRRGVGDVVAAKTGTATVSSCRGVHLVVAMAGTTEHSFGAWLHPGPKLFALVLCVHSYSQDRCDKTFVLLMRAPRCNHGRCYSMFVQPRPARHACRPVDVRLTAATTDTTKRSSWRCAHLAAAQGRHDYILRPGVHNLRTTCGCGLVVSGCDDGGCGGGGWHW